MSLPFFNNILLLLKGFEITVKITKTETEEKVNRRKETHAYFHRTDMAINTAIHFFVVIPSCMYIYIFGDIKCTCNVALKHIKAYETGLCLALHSR